MANRFASRLSLLYGAFFLYAGLSLPFMPVWFAAKGLDAREIGIVLAVPLAVRVIVVPLATRAADRFSRVRPALVAASVASVAGLILVGFNSGFLAILLSFALAAAAIAPVLPLADAYALRGLKDRVRSYGPIRLWGSVTFILANLGGGTVLAWLGAGDVIWAVVAALALNAAAAFALAPLPPDPPDPAETPTAGVSLWRAPGFAAVALGAGLIQASHAVLYGFATLQWEARGIDGLAIGALWAIGVIAEVGLFACSGRLIAWLGAPGTIVLGGFGGLIRWTAMAFDPPTATLPFLQALHALSFAATHLGTMHFLARAAPAGRGATAQGDVSALQGIVFATAMSLSGLLVAAHGNFAYAAMAVASGIGALLAVSAVRLTRRAPA
jgi:MFS transporter, PPP family, 3-phenylpropionic acid transporter